MTTHQSTNSSNYHQYWKAIFALCLCSLTHAYLLINIFPYAGYMAMDLLPNRTNQENAGSYAGLLASSFMIGRALFSYHWGKWADSFGRISVLYVSLVLSCIFSILFGMSQTFWGALVFRCLLGASNGIVAITKTLVSELAKGNEGLETRGMALVMGMRGLGFLIAPAIGGALAEVTKQYPHAKWVHRHHEIYSTFPFMLPNLVGALFCIVSIIAVGLGVEETKHRKRHRTRSSFRDWFHKRLSHLSRISEEESMSFHNTPLTWYTSTDSLASEHSDESEQASSSQQSTTLLHSIHEHRATTTESTIQSIWSQQDTRQCLIIYWLYSFIIIAVDEAFPLYCISLNAGLGLMEADIGKILSLSGLLFVILQYVCYTRLVDSIGIYGSLVVGSVVTIPTIFLIPLSRLLQTTPTVLNTSLFAILAILLGFYRIFANVFFASIAIATNRTVSMENRASTNGLSQLGGSIFKAIGPAISGVACGYSFSSRIPYVGALIVFGIWSLLAALVVVLVVTWLEPLLVVSSAMNGSEGTEDVDEEAAANGGVKQAIDDDEG